ncbi:MAG: family 43 glycosylhydrolase [Pleurocapsa sp. SU_196_0]|nr:family 43 glycosylhydrolase [Pleurocapsa sp. SU_196_0]
MSRDAAPATYTNPVYPHYFADPFVLEVDGTYYAYGTGQSSFRNGRVFEVLQSDDLVHWQSLGGALEPLGAAYRDYWAPEVARHDAHFYMYYSAGVGDAGHRLRVAVSDHPRPVRGYRRGADRRRSVQHRREPFRDDDGQWYLFYARDFLDGERVGTALAVDRLSDMTRLTGQPATVLRASSDWQLYARDRRMYGGIHDWHTLEGPFVVKRGGRYYCFYSGGAWPEPSYGVSYAVADHPMGPWHEPRADGPTVLRTIPGRVIGPGHNSVVTGPDGQDYLVYHAWDAEKTGRRMCIDPLEWTPEGPITSGPSFTPRAVPR